MLRTLRCQWGIEVIPEDSNDSRGECVMSDQRLRKAVKAALTTFLVALLLATLLANTEEQKLGTQVYEKKCVMCHGQDGVGDTKAGKMMKAPDLTKSEWKNGTSSTELAKTLREGLGKMPKYEGKLSDEELNAVAEYAVSKFAKEQ